jgi:integrase/recombinase XerD
MKTTLESCLSSSIRRYVELKQALGRRFAIEARVLELLDAFMARAGAVELNCD